jgi:hypothetical protein
MLRDSLKCITKAAGSYFVIPIAYPMLFLPRILGIVLVKIVGVAFPVPSFSFTVCAARAVPEVVCLAVHAV